MWGKELMIPRQIGRLDRIDVHLLDGPPERRPNGIDFSFVTNEPTIRRA